MKIGEIFSLGGCGGRGYGGGSYGRSGGYGVLNAIIVMGIITGVPTAATMASITIVTTVADS